MWVGFLYSQSELCAWDLDHLDQSEAWILGSEESLQYSLTSLFKTVVTDNKQKHNRATLKQKSLVIRLATSYSN